MSVLIANFGYSVGEDNAVAFFDLSLGEVVSYSWQFGDGNSSTDENPTHQYNSPGVYKVKLTVTDSNGETQSYLEKIYVGSDENYMYISVSILELLGNYIPEVIKPEANYTERINLIRKWQLYLQPIVCIPKAIGEKDIYNETKWPGLLKILIAQLCAYDIILQAANAFMSQSISGSETNTDNESGGEEATGEQQIKSIETGPAKTEWYEDTTKADEAERAEKLASAIASVTKAGGALDHLKESICQMASRVRVYLPMCGQLDHSPILPKVIKKHGRGGHNANPFGITDRML